MQEYSKSANACIGGFSQTDATPDVDTSLSPRESSTSAAVVPIATASNIPASAATSANPATSNSESNLAKSVVKLRGIGEVARTGKTSLGFWTPPFEAEKGSEASIEEIIQRAELVRAPLFSTPAPSGSAQYGTTDELFARLQDAIARQASLPLQTSALLSFWTISTWCSDGLSYSPGLVIVGPPHEGDLVLRTLRHYCRYPLMMTGFNLSALKKLNWDTTPTLLLYDPNVTTQMATILSCATTRGYMVADAGKFRDFFGPKAVYIGEEAFVDRTPRCSLQVNVNPTTAAASQRATRLSESSVQDLQNQLLLYRLTNLVRVYNSEFDASTLMSDTRAIANAFGACIIDSPELQAQLISLLAPVENQRQADRSTGIEAVILQATLNLCHEGKPQFLVGEVATEANRIVEARAERLHYSAEKIGHQLKKVGISTRRLGKAGKGLVVDLTTVAQIHELAALYGGVGLEQDENNPHCPLCIENKLFMQVM